ncbi:type II toxin-antitoxin system HipA family toxin [Cellulomonas hominis]|uniref:type II toxin-antitoxin system HipA family toxin n=1 Tax=Cellulomonas hominis TaxID=156981 RepID=UPI001B8F19D0|nr:type II toxin-antitoxin system HipA family toxin [Cellulomonas hominis]VTR76300.1 hypothetical protein CHMI_01057 [Cellulomonas hominis]
MTGPVTVHVVLPDGEEVEAGTLRTHASGRNESATFVYAEAFLRDRRAYAIDPALPLQPGPFHTGGEPVFRSMADSAPDRWGQGLLRRAERSRADDAGATPRTLLSADFLLGVHDELRQGALRYTRDGEYLSPADRGVPRLVDLPRLLDLTDRMLADPDLDAGLRDLVDAGGSLGGARPKAAVRDHAGALQIAKFPRKGSDDWDVMAWEKVALDLAARAGIAVPNSALITVAGRNVLVLDRFDRDGDRRIGYVSAMTMMEAHERTDDLSAVELAEEMETGSAAPEEDLHELFRRCVFSALINNTDNHLRNHGFLRRQDGWVLSPAFDMNPDPEGSTPAMPIVPGGGDLSDAVELADAFRLDRAQALEQIGQVAAAVGQWRDLAESMGIHGSEITLMRRAFDNPDAAHAAQLVEAAGRASAPAPRPAAGGRARVPAGVRTGGQFTSRQRGESDAQLG